MVQEHNERKFKNQQEQTRTQELIFIFDSKLLRNKRLKNKTQWQKKQDSTKNEQEFFQDSVKNQDTELKKQKSPI